MENVLKNFVTIEMFRFERPRLSIMNDEQIQEALNISTSMLDGICNGLISLVVQYSLSKEKKDPSNELYRTDFELEQIKHAVVFQTQYVLNLGNDFTIGSNSASTGGINYSFQRPESRQELAPGVKEFLARARVFELTNIGGSDNQKSNVDCSILKQLMNIEDGDRRYLQKYQPNADIGSIATISQGHTIEFVNPNNTNWAVKQAEMIKDKNGDYYYLWAYPNLAFFGDNVDNAISKREAYKAIWNALWWNKNTTYPNEAIVRYFDVDKNLVYTFKSNQDNNLNHDPLKDNKDNFWWKQVNSNDSVDIEALVNSVLGDKEFLNKINAIKGEFDNTLDAFWNQIKDNEHLLKKFEELYDQTKTENDQLEQKLDTKIETNKTNIEALDKDNIAYKNKENIFSENQTFNKYIFNSFGFWKNTDNMVLMTMKNQGQKNAKIRFEQNKNYGYRNHCRLAIEHRYSGQGDSEWKELWYIEPRNQGVAMWCIDNILSFNAITKIQNVDTPINNNDAANKKYVDDKVAQGGFNWANINVPVVSIHNDKVNIAYDNTKAEIMYGKNKITINEQGVNVEAVKFTANNLNNQYLQPDSAYDVVTSGYFIDHLTEYVAEEQAELESKLRHKIEQATEHVSNYQVRRFVMQVPSNAWTTANISNNVQDLKGYVLDITCFTSKPNGEDLYIKCKQYGWSGNTLVVDLLNQVNGGTPSQMLIKPLYHRDTLKAKEYLL